MEKPNGNDFTVNNEKTVNSHKTFKIPAMGIAILLLIIIITYMLGYRFTPEQAARANSWIHKDSILMGREDFGAAQVYLFENQDKYYTVIADYKFPFWRSGVNFWANKTEDKIKLVGWCSYTTGGKRITVVPVQCYDENVAYIEMGPEPERLRKDIPLKQTVIFSWEKSIPWNDLNGFAYSKDHKKLYRFGYEIKNNTINPSELRWFPFSQD